MVWQCELTTSLLLLDHSNSLIGIPLGLKSKASDILPLSVRTWPVYQTTFLLCPGFSVDMGEVHEWSVGRLVNVWPGVWHQAVDILHLVRECYKSIIVKFNSNIALIFTFFMYQDISTLERDCEIEFLFYWLLEKLRKGCFFWKIVQHETKAQVLVWCGCSHPGITFHSVTSDDENTVKPH